MAKYTAKRCKGYTFFFKHEPPEEELLHIYVRHPTNEVNVIEAFFTGKTTWNQQRERWETVGENHSVYRFWMDQKAKKIMVITCFNN